MVLEIFVRRPGFALAGDSSVANALRRLALGQTSSIAPTEVLIHRNDSVMSDEQLAHRIGLLVADSTRLNGARVVKLRATNDTSA